MSHHSRILGWVVTLFVYLGRAELGFTVVIVLAMALIAIRLNWKMRRYVWFWATIGLVLAIQVPLFFAIRWPDTKVPTIAFSMPLGIAEFLVISGAIRLAQKKFLKDLSPGDDQE